MYKVLHLSTYNFFKNGNGYLDILESMYNFENLLSFTPLPLMLIDMSLYSFKLHQAIMLSMIRAIVIQTFYNNCLLENITPSV